LGLRASRKRFLRLLPFCFFCSSFNFGYLKIDFSKALPVMSGGYLIDKVIG